MALAFGQPRIEQVLPNRDRLGETPLWCDRSSKLWWIDIEQPRLQSYDPSSGQHLVYPFNCDWLGSLALTTGTELIVATDLSLQRFNPTTGKTEMIAELERNLDNRLNDGRVDSRGRFWIGTMDNGLSEPNGSLYSIDPNAVTSAHRNDIIVSNGIAHSPDGRTLYLTDTRRFTTWAFDIDADPGTLGKQRVFADYSAAGERPDGATIDADGCLSPAVCWLLKELVRASPNTVTDEPVGF